MDPFQNSRDTLNLKYWIKLSAHMKLYNCRIQWSYNEFISYEDQRDDDTGK